MGLDDWFGSFRFDPKMRHDVNRVLNDTYAGVSGTRPNLDGVINDVIRTVVADIEERASELWGCDKVDDCAAQSKVLEHLAKWLEQGIR